MSRFGVLEYINVHLHNLTWILIYALNVLWFLLWLKGIHLDVSEMGRPVIMELITMNCCYGYDLSTNYTYVFDFKSKDSCILRKRYVFSYPKIIGKLIIQQLFSLISLNHINHQSYLLLLFCLLY